MNKVLLAVCIFFMMGLMADQDEKGNIALVEAKNRIATQSPERQWGVLETKNKEQTCETSCCPTPPPVCCTCYVPNYYDLECASGLFIYGDYLYWYANEDNLSPCMTVVGNNKASNTSSVISSVIQTFLQPVKVNHLETEWDHGFRAGLGYDFGCDGWDIEANYTWFHNTAGRVFSVPSFGFSTILGGGFVARNVSFPLFPNNGQLALVDPWINVAIVPNGSDPFLFDTINTSWKLTFNQLDLELGRKFWLGRYMAMRAYAGGRGAWYKTRFNNLAIKGPPPTSRFFQSSPTVNTFSDKFQDRVWGGGLLAGIQPEWHFCRNFILFSNIDAALLWGKFKVRKNEDYTSSSSSSNFVPGATIQTLSYHSSVTSQFFKMQAVLDLALGFRWEETWCSRLRTTLDVSWEHHIWFDANNRFKTYGNYNSSVTNTGLFTETAAVTGFQSYDELQGNLMMGGLVVNFRVDF